MNTTEANESLNEQKGKPETKFTNLFEEKIHAYEKIIAEFKTRLANETKEDIAKYEKKLAELEQKAIDMKNKLVEYKEEGKDKWDSFKLKFNHDLDELGKALKNFTVKSK
jgi:DNA-directed RNA polymerase alpha subunit